MVQRIMNDFLVSVYAYEANFILFVYCLFHCYLLSKIKWILKVLKMITRK